MDLKNKHFHSEAILHAPREVVLTAARSFAAESLAEWQIADTADGFEARGNSGAHTVVATLKIEPALFGTRVAVTLLVERASALGFMLFDVGGYYEGQIRKWLEGIQWQVHEVQRGEPSPPAIVKPEAAPKASPGARFIGYCFAFGIITFIVVFGASAIVGIITGDLYIAGRVSEGVTIHGIWARMVSAIILMILSYLAWVIFKAIKETRGLKRSSTHKK